MVCQYLLDGLHKVQLLSCYPGIQVGSGNPARKIQRPERRWPKVIWLNGTPLFRTTPCTASSWLGLRWENLPTMARAPIPSALTFRTASNFLGINGSNLPSPVVHIAPELVQGNRQG